jgi:hypothetical protein
MRAIVVASAILIGACGTAGSPPSPADPPAVAPPPEPPPPPVPPRCTLAADPPAAVTAHPDLLAVAPQYFHPGHRGGYDAYAGRGDVFPWFDEHDLEHPVLPPAGVRVAASTRSTLFTSTDGQLGTMARGSREVTSLGRALYPVEAVESERGDRWLLARSGTTYWIVYLPATGAPAMSDLGLSERSFDVRIATTSDGTPVLAWLEHEGEHLRVRVAFAMDPAQGRVVDEVTLPAPVAELSAISTVSLTLAAHASGSVAVAWRPLDDAGLTDVGSPSEPPGTPARAAIRWLVVGPASASAVQRAPVTAHPLGGVTGVGPWPLSRLAMTGTTVGGRAIFAWLGDDHVEAVHADEGAPIQVRSREGAPHLAFRAGGELLLFDTTPRIASIALRCR